MLKKLPKIGLRTSQRSFGNDPFASVDLSGIAASITRVDTIDARQRRKSPQQ
jgi:hypothetical protein